MKRTLALAAATTLTLAACGSDVPDTGSTDGQAPAAEQAGDVTPLPLNADGVLGGTATITNLDAGEPGTITTVHIGQMDGDALMFIFRNNTTDAISHVSASATVRDADGKLTATGSSQGSTPSQIPPGGLAMAYIYFPDGQVPDDRTIDFTFDASPADTSILNTGDLTVTELETTDDGVIGTATNENDATLSGPYGVSIYCFDQAGTTLKSHIMGFANEMGDVPPGGTVSFTERFFDPCPTYLLGVSGYFTS